MRGADGGVLRGAHLEGGGDDEAEIEGEIEELHVPRLEPPRVQPHLLRVGVRLGSGLGLGLGLMLRVRVRARDTPSLPSAPADTCRP